MVNRKQWLTAAECAEMGVKVQKGQDGMTLGGALKALARRRSKQVKRENNRPLVNSPVGKRARHVTGR